MLAPAAADASSWPAARGDAARTGVQAEPVALPAAVAWDRGGAAPMTEPIVTGGDGPFEQRVAYGTADGRVHLRVLATGAAVGPPGGLLVADAAVTDRARALRSAFVSTSSDTRPGLLFVVHDDGGGVEIATVDEFTGMRVGFDAALPGGLGCSEAGAPLLTPPAADGTRLLFFTISGPCSAGEGLVRVPVEADGTLGAPAVGAVEDPLGDPALIMGPAFYAVAVGHPGGVDLFKADSSLAAPNTKVQLDPGERPVALGHIDTELFVLSRFGDDSLLRRVPWGDDGRRVRAYDGEPTGLAVEADRVLVTTSAALYVLRPDLSTATIVPGGGTAPSVAGDLAFQGGRAVDLLTGAETALPVSDVAPALARGFVVHGSFAMTTTDVTPPGLTDVRGLAATAADDRGIAFVRFLIGARLLPGEPQGSRWAPTRHSARAPSTLAPGSYAVRVQASDLAGNVASASTRLRVGCDRRRAGARGADRLRGGPRRDCIDARAGADVVRVAGGGADRVRCGPGRDRVRADRSDRLAIDCEVVKRRAGR